MQEVIAGSKNNYRRIEITSLFFIKKIIPLSQKGLKPAICNKTVVITKKLIWTK